jgi:thiosulfate reductase cytochrome b subunit
MADPSQTHLFIHPALVRIWHWINAAAMIVMIMSGWRIYNASPVFSFIRFPNEITLGGWLAGALQWHFAAMWVLMANFLIYVIYGLWSGHFRRVFLPVTPDVVLKDLQLAMQFKLPHTVGSYNAVQRFAYVGVLSAIVLTILAGLAVWKPVQFSELAWLMGGYDGARVVHFLGMSAIVAFIVIHLALVLIVPSTLLPMFTGKVKLTGHAAHQAKEQTS